MKTLDDYIAVARKEDEERRMEREKQDKRNAALLAKRAQAFVSEHGLESLLTALGAQFDQGVLIGGEHIAFSNAIEYPLQINIQGDTKAVSGRFTFSLVVSNYPSGHIAFDTVLPLPANDAQIGKYLDGLLTRAESRSAADYSMTVDSMMRATCLEDLTSLHECAISRWPMRKDEINEAFKVGQDHIAERTKLEASWEMDDDENERAKRQAEVWHPFVAYRVRYALTDRDDDGEPFFDIQRVTTLSAEPDENQWWLRANGNKMRIRNVITVERLEIWTPDDCARAEIEPKDGIYYPPESAERLDIAPQQ